MAEVYNTKPRQRGLIGWLIILLAALVVGGLTIHSYITKAYSSGYSAVDAPLLADTDTRELQALNREFTALAKAVTPAVVNISTTKVIKPSEEMPLDPLLRDPFFRRFFGPELFRQMPREQKEHALGSGVVVGRDGFIVTNNHVIEKASEIKVALPDKRSFNGKVVGSDPATDIAVVRIDASGLPALPWGDSDKLQVGESVMAVGNPFGLSQTVTRGIVSATGRSNLNLIGPAGYEDFIQTDAAINPGNSGGALVNVRGELVGVNTAIISQSGSFAGVGFAVPSKLAKDVMTNLVQHGKVTRGWLGVQIQAIAPELAKQFNLKDTRGALVSEVQPNSPAERAGLQVGDVIVEYNGKPVEDSNALRLLVAQTPAGTTVPIKVIRQDREQTLQLNVAEMPKDVAQSSRRRPGFGGGGGGSERNEYNNALKGLAVQNLTPESARRQGLRPDMQGVVITDVDPDSAAAAAGLQPGDVITEVNRQRVTNTDDLDRIARNLKASDSVLLRVSRGGGSFYIVLSPSG